MYRQHGHSERPQPCGALTFGHSGRQVGAKPHQFGSVHFNPVQFIYNYYRNHLKVSLGRFLVIQEKLSGNAVMATELHQVD